VQEFFLCDGDEEKFLLFVAPLDRWAQGFRLVDMLEHDDDSKMKVGHKPLKLGFWEKANVKIHAFSPSRFFSFFLSQDV